MKFSSEDLMKAMGLQVGDRIKINNTIYLIKKINTNSDSYIFATDETNNEKLLIHFLIDLDYEILPRPNRVGDEYCRNIDCNKCPLKCMCMGDVGGTLYDSWELYKSPANAPYFDQEIYELLKARLDKEVK